MSGLNVKFPQTPRPYSVIYLGKDGANYSFFIHQGIFNDQFILRRDRGTRFNTFSTLDVNIGVFNVRAIEYTNTNSIIIENDELDIQLQAYEAPLNSIINLTESSVIYLKFPKVKMDIATANSTPASNGQIYSLITQIEDKITTEVVENDLIYLRSDDQINEIINSYYTDVPTGEDLASLDFNGYFYVKLAEVFIENESVRIDKAWSSNFFAPLAYSKIEAGLAKGISVRVGYSYANNQFLDTTIGDEEKYNQAEWYYSNVDWILKSQTEILALAESRVIADFKEIVEQWVLNNVLDAHSAPDVQVHEIYVYYLKYFNEIPIVDRVFRSINPVRYPLDFSGRTDLEDLVIADHYPGANGYVNYLQHPNPP